MKQSTIKYNRNVNRNTRKKQEQISKHQAIGVGVVNFGIMLWLSCIVLALSCVTGGARSCFSLDTEVFLGDFTTKPISAIKEGDEVLSWDVSKNVTVTR